MQHIYKLQSFPASSNVTQEKIERGFYKMWPFLSILHIIHNEMKIETFRREVWHTPSGHFTFQIHWITDVSDLYKLFNESEKWSFAYNCGQKEYANGLFFTCKTLKNELNEDLFIQSCIAYTMRWKLKPIQEKFDILPPANSFFRFIE
jgi:hypothetical protein